MVTTSGGVPQRHGTQTDFTSGIPVGNKGPKGGKGKSKTPTQPKKVTPKKK